MNPAEKIARSRLDQLPRSAEFRRLNPHLYPEDCPVSKLTEKLVEAARVPAGRKMNLTEARMAAILERRPGVESYKFEGVSLKWGWDQKTGQSMRYKPDFFVKLHGGRYLCVEVKGRKVWDRDIVRFKGCRAEWIEFDFELWQWAENKWTRILYSD